MGVVLNEEMMSNAESLTLIINLFSYLIEVAVSIFAIVCTWKIYSKAGEHGWACFIPFYNEYVAFKVAKKRGLFVPYLISSVLAIISLMTAVVSGVVYMGIAFSTAVSAAEEALATAGTICLVSFITLMVLLVVMCIINIVKSIGMARAFGQGGGFAVGLILVPIVFNAILAFSKNINYNFDYMPPSDNVFSQS